MIIMKKIIGFLINSIIIVSIISTVFFFQLNGCHDENNILRDEIFDISNSLKEEQLQTAQLEEQVSELQTQVDDLQEQNNNLQTQIGQLNKFNTINSSSVVLTITNFTITGFAPLAGTWIWSDARITIQNLGTYNLEGLTLELTHPKDYPEGFPNPSTELESINASEEKTIVVKGVSWELASGLEYIIKIKLDNMTLFESNYFAQFIS